MEWISVKDKLPDDMQSYLICTDTPSEVCRSTAIYVKGEWKVVNYNHGGFDVMTDVTHYMHLPKPA